MRFKVLLTEDAERDLEDIFTYVAEHDCRQKADYVLDRLIEGDLTWLTRTLWFHSRLIRELGIMKRGNQGYGS